MTTPRFSIAALILALATTVAVSTLVAQSPPAPPTPPVPPAPPMLFADGASRIGAAVVDEMGASASGVRIERVDADGPAARAGLRTGDIVTQYDGERVRSARQLTRLVRETPGGRAVALTVTRDGQAQSLTITPEATADATPFVDGERIRRDVERSLRNLPRFEGFPFDGRAGMAARRRLGVEVAPLSTQLADYFGATSGGVLVETVVADSAAAKAGLRAGDVITAIDARPVREPSDLAEALADSDTGNVTVHIVRGKSASTLKATVEPRPSTRQTTRNRRQV